MRRLRRSAARAWSRRGWILWPLTGARLVWASLLYPDPAAELLCSTWTVAAETMRNGFMSRWHAQAARVQVAKGTGAGSF